MLPARARRLVGRCVEPCLAALAGLVHADRLPDIALCAGGLDEGRIAAESGEAEACVLAEKCVGVVFAHGGRFVGWSFWVDRLADAEICEECGGRW